VCQCHRADTDDIFVTGPSKHPSETECLKARRDRFVKSKKYLFYTLHSHRRRRSPEAIRDGQMTQGALIHAVNKVWGLMFLDVFVSCRVVCEYQSADTVCSDGLSVPRHSNRTTSDRPHLTCSLQDTHNLLPTQYSMLKGERPLEECG
jgi:hypothetical protein